jgi:SAM-dependent methyltransferase
VTRPEHEDNRASWNAATPALNARKGDLGERIAAGLELLWPEELELLGDVAGKRIVHLQCHNGSETLCLSRLAGVPATGVDIADAAIELGRAFAERSGIAAEFVRADVLDWLAETEDRYDVAFCSYGAVCWISDLDAWAAGIARVLRPGGRFVAVDYHPEGGAYNERFERDWPSTGGVRMTVEEGIQDYESFSAGVATDFANPHRSHDFVHSVAEIVGALLDAGLRLDALRDWPWANGSRRFEAAEDLGDGRWGTPPGTPPMPLMYGIAATRA